MLFFVTGEEATNNKTHDHFDKHWPGSVRDDVYTKRYKFEEKKLSILNRFLTMYKNFINSFVFISEIFHLDCV